MASETMAEVRVTPARWISRGWQVVSADLGSFVLMTVIALALTMIGHFIVAGPLLAGLFIAVRRRMLESRTEIADVFAGFAMFLDALLIGIISSVFLLIGFVLLVFPVFIAAALYLFPYLFLIDRRLTFWNALEASRRLSIRNLAGYVVFAIALALLNFIGLLFFGVGVLLTIPITVAAITVAYSETVGFQYKPEPPAGPVVIG